MLKYLFNQNWNFSAAIRSMLRPPSPIDQKCHSRTKTFGITSNNSQDAPTTSSDYACDSNSIRMLVDEFTLSQQNTNVEIDEMQLMRSIQR